MPSTENVSVELHFLVDWPDPLAIFLSNLSDRLHRRVVPSQDSTSVPDRYFWCGVDLQTPFPRRGVIDSVFAHVALLGLLYAVSIWPQSAAHLPQPFSRRALEGYKLSEYLPELHGAPTHTHFGGKRDPVLARQEIRSLPKSPDNLRQTIITPPKLKLRHDVELPNIVAYEPAAPIQPLAASARDSASLRLPAFIPEVIAPAAETGSLHSRTKLPTFTPAVVEPTPDVMQKQDHPRLAVSGLVPKVVAPAPDLGHVSRNPSSLAHLAPSIVPLAPHVGDAQHASGQIIALSLHPADIHAPPKIPSGNRLGAFAASPSGHPSATGAPGADASSGTAASESKALVNAPAGISVAPAPPAISALSPRASADNDVRARLVAATRTPVPSIPPRQPLARETTGPRSELENRFFAGRRSYTLSVNMPNLNTATGSWIIHFVEREPGSAQIPIAAPEVVSKSDPAYPGELLHDRVQGTVILTAIIRSDGSVSDIAVAKSLDPRLDQNAVQALSHWLFRPALKNGQAIDLEAVITVPFRVKATGF